MVQRFVFMNIDQGTQFGRWEDETSRLMYFDAMPVLLSGIDTAGVVADYGGGNGLLKQWIPDAISIDTDTSKQPDVVGDVLTHTGNYDLIVMRYLLHYLDVNKIDRLFRHLAAFHSGRVLVIQFVNDDLKAKQANSVNESKTFFTESQLTALLSRYWTVTPGNAIDYTVSAEFYRNRLKHPTPTAHRERLIALNLERK